jgi:hypothetical protein
MANDATDSRRGTGSSTENYPTRRTEPTATTPTLASSGVAASATSDVTPARSSPLSADEAQRLYRIRKDRANRFMVSAVDVDFLLEVIERRG